MIENDFKSLNFSVIGHNSELEGEFKFHGDTLLNCNLKGEITMLDQGKLTLERNSIFSGNIYCEDIEIFGEVVGSINASGTLSVRSSANVSGIINAKSINIYPGATLNIEGHTSEDSPE
jgi:cytoskeletal protein CcmA (bactofilin family)